MTPRQHALLANHRDVANLMLTTDRPIFWIADLSDAVGFNVALKVHGKRDVLEDKRDATLAISQIPAFTFSTTREAAKMAIEQLYGRLLPDVGRIMIVLSDDTMTAIKL